MSNYRGEKRIGKGREDRRRGIEVGGRRGGGGGEEEKGRGELEEVGERLLTEASRNLRSRFSSAGLGVGAGAPPKLT